MNEGTHAKYNEKRLHIFKVGLFKELHSLITRRKLQLYFCNSTRIKLIPHVFLFQWDVIIELGKIFYLASIQKAAY